MNFILPIISDLTKVVHLHFLHLKLRRKLYFPNFPDPRTDPKVRLLDELLHDGEKNLEARLTKVAKKCRQSDTYSYQLETLDDVFRLREGLKYKCGGDLKKAFYTAIRVVPDAKWKEFVRATLGLSESEIEKHPSDTLSRDNKFEMLLTWADQKIQKMGQNPAAEEFIDILVGFLDEKGLVGRILENERPFDGGGGENASSTKSLRAAELSAKCNGNLSKAFYKAIDIVPNGNWKEFVLVYLELNLPKYRKYDFDALSSDGKYGMLLAWSEKMTGKSPSCDEFCDIVAEFLADKNIFLPTLTSTVNIERVVQHNYGEVHADTFNGYVTKKCNH